LVVLEILSSEESATICEGESYTFNGVPYNQSGTYVDTLQAQSGCDSIATLNLVVLELLSSEESATICEGDSYIFNGGSFSQTGTYVDTLQSQSGCDSIATLNLVVLEILSSEVSATICEGDSYTFNGVSYSQTGTY